MKNLLASILILAIINAIAQPWTFSPEDLDKALQPLKTNLLTLQR